MMMKKGMIKKKNRYFTTSEVIQCALISALGIALKPLLVPLSHLVTGPLHIPGGVVAGGFYMMWLILGYALVNKRGTATLISFTQAMLVIILGFSGGLGVITFLAYLAPGICVDVLYVFLSSLSFSPTKAFLGGLVANTAGTLVNSILVLGISGFPLVFILSVAALSGGMGGLLAHSVSKEIYRVSVPARELS